MKIEDYSKYYIQGSDHYLIPKDIFDELFTEMGNWKKESQKQKEVINKVIKLIEENYYKQSDDYYDYFTEGVCLQDGDYQELEDILKEVE